MADVQFNNNADVIFNDGDVIWVHNVPVLTTDPATDLADASFNGHATITEHGGENPSRRGFCFIYGVEGDPTIDDNVVYDDGDFAPESYFLSVAVTAGQSVRYRAYAQNNMGIGYGETRQVIIIVVPDAFVSTGSLSAALLCNLSADPLASLGTLSASKALSFINTEEFTVSYKCTFADIDLPIKSFSARFSTAQKSQVSVVIPGLDYANIISDTVIDNHTAGLASLGSLSVFMVKTFKSGNVIRERLSIVDLENIGYVEDVTMGTIKEITLSGSMTETWSPKTVTLTGASYRSVIGGNKSYRCSPDLYLRPGDTVIVNGETFTVNAITWFFDDRLESMTVSEDAA